MPKLAVGKLMQATATRYTKVAPHILAGLEVQVLHSARGRLEPLIRVLGCYAGTDHVTFKLIIYALKLKS